MPLPVSEGESPLRLFSDCREEILAQFEKLKDITNETEHILEAYEKFSHHETNLVALSPGQQLNDNKSDHIHKLKDIQQFREVVSNITAMLRRDSMKVVFVGHTSNGKSTVINSMLGQKVLPMGIGHTTSCFCSVTGTDEEPYIILGHEPKAKNSNSIRLNRVQRSDSPPSPPPEKRMAIDNVKTVANALCPESDHDAYQFVRVFWDKRKCNLLGDGVLFVDTPGLDIDENYDNWIDKFCMDADVFVLVANGESTIKHTEMNFFTKVAEKLSRPNVFILFNRWDGSDMEDDVTPVQEQHKDRVRSFFKKELQQDANIIDKRVFFVSGKEVLTHRTKPDKSVVKESNPSPMGRYNEFERFEHEFEQCISLSAIQTKFEGHVVRGSDIVVKLSEWVKRVTYTVKLQRRECVSRLAVRKKQIEALDNQKEASVRRCEQIISAMTRDISDMFDKELKTVLDHNLARIVKRFDYAIFRPHNMVSYKKRLYEYLCTELLMELEQVCTETLNKRYTEAIRDMEEEMSSMVSSGLNSGLGVSNMSLQSQARLNEESRAGNGESSSSGYEQQQATTSSNGYSGTNSALNLSERDSATRHENEATLAAPPGVVRVLEGVFTTEVMSGFNEDIDFYFSLGWRSIGPRLLGYSTFRAVDSLFMGSGPQAGGAANGHAAPSGVGLSSTEMTVGGVAVIVPLVSQLTMSSIITCATLSFTVLSKPSVWKAVGVATGAYTLLYTVEFMTYTNSARERRLKQQVIDYAYDKFLSNASYSTSNVAQHYKVGARIVLDDLKCQINEHKSTMFKEKGILEKAMQTLAKLVNGGDSVVAHSDEIVKAFEEYSQRFIADV